MTKKRWILLACAVVAAMCVVVVLVRPMLQTPLSWERHAAAAAGIIREYSGTLAESVSPSEQMTLAAQKGHVALFVDMTTGEFVLEDLRDGRYYHSNPADRENEEFASGNAKNELSANLVVSVRKREGNSLKTLNSYTHSQRKSGVQVSAVEDGVRVVYTFPEEGVTIPVEYVLLGDSVEARVRTEEIEDSGDYAVMSVSILPYFAAAGSGEEGYFLLPDGSGSLLYFNTLKYTHSAYRVQLYGGDRVSTPDYVMNVQQKASLPVFGCFVEGERGLMAIATQGAGAGYVNASASQQKTSYNNAFFEFECRINYKTSIGVRHSWDSKEVAVYEDGAIRYPEIAVRYFPLAGEKEAHLAYGAQLCADYLDALGPAPELPDALPAFVSLYGGTQVSTSTLGIQHQKTLTAATFAQAEGMVKEMAEQGIPLWLTYANWEKNALKETIPDHLSPLSALGGQKALDSLEERLQASGGRLFLEAQTVFFSQSGNGISANQHAVKDFNHSVSLQDRYSPSTGFMPSDETSYRMLGAFEAIRRLQTASVSLPGVYVPDLAGTLYSDFSDNGLSRTRMAEETAFALGELAQTTPLMADDPNFYAMASLAGAINLSDSSSGFDITDHSVPFVGMVLHGRTAFAYGAANLGGDPQSAFLETYAVGGCPHFTFIFTETNNLLQSDLNGLYACEYEANKADFVQQYEALAELYAKTGKARIAEYTEPAAGVAVTRYENGWYTVVNSSDTACVYAGETVEAGGFILREAPQG